MSKLHAILEQSVPGLGYELVDVELAPSRLIRVFIDKEGGVTIDDCEKVSNHLTKLFVVEEVDFNRLEVSSPGLERPLKKLEDFFRFKGKIVKIKTKETIDGQKIFQGVIDDVIENKVRLLMNKNNAESNVLEFDFVNINRARLVFDYKKERNS